MSLYMLYFTLNYTHHVSINFTNTYFNVHYHQIMMQVIISPLETYYIPFLNQSHDTEYVIEHTGFLFHKVAPKV
jgi:hypothetical protein